MCCSFVDTSHSNKISPSYCQLDPISSVPIPAPPNIRDDGNPSLLIKITKDTLHRPLTHSNNPSSLQSDTQQSHHTTMTTCTYITNPRPPTLSFFLSELVSSNLLPSTPHYQDQDSDVYLSVDSCPGGYISFTLFPGSSRARNESRLPCHRVLSIRLQRRDLEFRLLHLPLLLQLIGKEGTFKHLHPSPTAGVIIKKRVVGRLR